MANRKEGNAAEDKMARYRQEFADDKRQWDSRRRDFNKALKMVFGDQWESDARNARKNSGSPVLQFNELAIEVERVANKKRKERPEPKVVPEDTLATSEAAEALEGHMRHCFYKSQATAARDMALTYTAAGGFGPYRVNLDFVEPPGRGAKLTAQHFRQEPRIERILDPNTVTPGFAEKADFSDMKRCWVGRPFSRTEFKAEFGRDPVPLDSTESGFKDWYINDDKFWVRERWSVVTSKRRMVQLKDGTIGYSDEIPDFDENEVDSEREEKESSVKCEVMDGAGVLRTTDWPGKWIPILMMVAQQVVVDGKPMCRPVIWDSIDSQKMLNASGSNVALTLGMMGRAPLFGPKGMYSGNPAWKDFNQKNYPFIEYELVYDQNGNLVPAKPERAQWEAPIQALMASIQWFAEGIRTRSGYFDPVTGRTESELSGKAIQRRTDQSDLVNFHISDNADLTIQHEGRVVLDLILNVNTFPVVLPTRQSDGKPGKHALFTTAMQDEDGNVTTPDVEGHEGEPHMRIDQGNYMVTVEPGYESKRDEESDVLGNIIMTDPALMPILGDIYFKLRGYPDLQERMELALAPAIQQAIQQKQQGGKPNPQVLMAQVTQLKTALQQIQQALQQAMMVIKTKQIESQGRLAVEQTRQAGEIEREHIKTARDAATLGAEHAHDRHMKASDNRHDATATMLQEQTDAIEHALEIITSAQQAAMQPQQPQQPQGGQNAAT